MKKRFSGTKINMIDIKFDNNNSYDVQIQYCRLVKKKNPKREPRILWVIENPDKSIQVIDYTSRTKPTDENWIKFIEVIEK